MFLYTKHTSDFFKNNQIITTSRIITLSYGMAKKIIMIDLTH